jgi:hypothetical protein
MKICSAAFGLLRAENKWTDRHGEYKKCIAQHFRFECASILLKKILSHISVTEDGVRIGNLIY